MTPDRQLAPSDLRNLWPAAYFLFAPDARGLVDDLQRGEAKAVVSILAARQEFWELHTLATCWWLADHDSPGRTVPLMSDKWGWCERDFETYCEENGLAVLPETSLTAALTLLLIALTPEQFDLAAAYSAEAY